MKTIGTERPDTELAVILGVDTHLHLPPLTSTSTWRLPWTTWAEAWARQAGQRPQRVTRSSCAGRRVLGP